jgi:hypothetical protein
VKQTPRTAQRPLSRIFAVPLALGVVSAVGLIAALVGDDLWDAVGWLGLGIPLIVTAWCLLPVRRAS